MTIIRTLAAAVVGLGVLGLPPVSQTVPAGQASLFTASSAEAGDRDRHGKKHAKKRDKDDRYGKKGHKYYGKRSDKHRHAEKHHDRYRYDRYAHKHVRRDDRKPRYYDDRRYYGPGPGVGVFFGVPLTIVIRP